MNYPRRAVLSGLAASAAMLPAPLRAARRVRVGIVGGGILGASIAARLAGSGAEVVLFDRQAPASGATRASVAWINPVVNDAHYMQLRLESMKAWHEDDRRHGMNAIWGGSINWVYDEEKRQALQVKADLLKETDDPPRFLTAQEIRAASPGISAGDDVSLAFQTARDGHVDPVHATQRYLAAATARGARVVYPCAVTGVTVENGRLRGVRTTQGNFALDHLVSAAGTDTPAVMAMLGRKLELAHKPGLVVHTDRQPVLTRMVYEASGVLEFKQYAYGRFLTSLTGGPPSAPHHADILNHRAGYPSEELSLTHGRMLIARTSEYMPAIAKAEPSQVLIGFRPYPLDNRPICGPVPDVAGVYVVVTHSGITLAPILGRYVAREILANVQAPLLAPYRPARFLTT